MRRYEYTERTPPPRDAQSDAPQQPQNSLQASLHLFVDGFMVFLQCAYRLQHDDRLMQQFGTLAPPAGSRILLHYADAHTIRILALLPPSTTNSWRYYYTARAIERGPHGRTLIAGAVTVGPPTLALLENLVVTAGFSEQDVHAALTWMDRQTGRQGTRA